MRRPARAYDGGMTLALEPIGFVKCAVSEGRDDAWGSVVSEVRLDERFAAGLAGLEEFSHALIIFWMHQATFKAETDLQRRPRGRADMPELGIFAQRAKHRPNPIAVTAVEIVERRGATLMVRGLDAIDETPVLDIKPYFPIFDSIENPKVPEWVNRLMTGYF